MEGVSHFSLQSYVFWNKYPSVFRITNEVEKPTDLIQRHAAASFNTNEKINKLGILQLCKNPLISLSIRSRCIVAVYIDVLFQF